MDLQQLLAAAASELALFAAVGFLLFALDDLAVDLIYFVRRGWRAATVYRSHERAHAGNLAAPSEPGPIAILVPAWDEARVIAQMLEATLDRLRHEDYSIFVGHYRNDPATAAAIASVADPRIVPVRLGRDGPTTKADCLNGIYQAMVARELASGKRFKAMVLHDAEDVVHPLELRIFDRLIERAAVVQLPVVPLPDRGSRWIGGHYCDEFAEAHGKELVVREAVGASMPLAGVGCAISRPAMARLASLGRGRPFADASLTEDYELGLRLGALGERAMFVRLPAGHGSRVVVASRGHFPASLDAAVRQKARWLRGIALTGWQRLGWSGGLGERWMRLRDRRGPLAAVLLAAGYAAALLWGQLSIAGLLGAAPPPPISPLLQTLLLINLGLLSWRLAVRAGFTASAYGWREGLRSVPRTLVANLIAMLAARRALFAHAADRPMTWDKTDHVFPREIPS